MLWELAVCGLDLVAPRLVADTEVSRSKAHEVLVLVLSSMSAFVELAARSGCGLINSLSKEEACGIQECLRVIVFLFVVCVCVCVCVVLNCSFVLRATRFYATNKRVTQERKREREGEGERRPLTVEVERVYVEAKDVWVLTVSCPRTLTLATCLRLLSCS